MQLDAAAIHIKSGTGECCQSGNLHIRSFRLTNFRYILLVQEIAIASFKMSLGSPVCQTLEQTAFECIATHTVLASVPQFLDGFFYFKCVHIHAV